MKKILVIDDEEWLREMVHLALQQRGYEVIEAQNGSDGVAIAVKQMPDLVLCDVNMEKLDGYATLSKLRNEPATATIPFILMTGLADNAGMRHGMELGADDYLPKTFSSRELLARLRAVLRRTGWIAESAPQAPIKELVIGELRINPETHDVVLGDQPVQLTPAEFGLLLSLAKAHGRVKTREQLIEEVADREWDVFDRAIDMHISTLRKKLGDDPKEPRFIKTVRGYGYQLVTPGR